MSAVGRVLIVEDNEAERRALTQLLKAADMTVFGAENADKALGYIDENIDVVISDLRMGDVSGMDLLSLWKKRRSDTHFVLLTGHSSVGSAVEAIKKGAYDYITKPVNPDELVVLIKRAIDINRKDEEIESLRRRLDQKYGVDNIIGTSRLMMDVFAKIQRAAPVDSTVLILGESGTGKELVAQALHHNSKRKKGAFVPVNIAAVPSTLIESELFGHVRGAFTGATDRRVGRFEQADGGTLFIDEIGDFELSLQAKLLRVIETLTVTPVGGAEDRKVDVRVVAATSRDILDMVKDGSFREDLYYRLHVVTIDLPPLRDRPDDIPVLIEHFLKDIAESKHTDTKRISPEVIRKLMAYAWPGNVRELRNSLESMMVLSDGEVIQEFDLPDRIRNHAVAGVPAKSVPTGMKIEDIERIAILQALERNGGNRTHAAQQVGMSVRTLQRKLRQYDLDRDGKDSKDPAGDVLAGV